MRVLRSICRNPELKRLGIVDSDEENLPVKGHLTRFYPRSRPARESAEFFARAFIYISEHQGTETRALKPTIRSSSLS